MSTPLLSFLCFLGVCGALICSGQGVAGQDGEDPEREVLTNQFYALLHGEPTDEEARRVGEDTGFTLLRRHLYSPNEFVYVHSKLPQIHAPRSLEQEQLLTGHPKVNSAQQMNAYKRRKRGFRAESGLKKKGIPGRKAADDRASLYRKPNDPLFDKEWYIRNTGQAGGKVGLDLNAEAAWAQGITGKGITTAIMDDGIDYLHADIAPNFNHESSYDYSSNDPFPYPRYTDDWFNSHGTRCAGEISAMRDNGVCGVGVAYNSKVAGLRMLDQPFMTDLIEAAAMSHDRQNIHIYSASWGPTDDGRTVDGPRNQTLRAIVDGVNKGRGGKGSIYVWASGDGGALDDCNCDGYAASMWTISINSATNDGQRATYDESCSSTLASTFSNGKQSLSQDAGVGTIDLYGNCTLHHSGTSAAAPEAAAVFALALEANPDLTWRDLQHIIVLTSKRNHLHDHTAKHNWTINGAGLEFNHLFGYGVLDAGDMVTVAKEWKTMPERYHCVAGEMKKPRVFNASRYLELEFETDGCQGFPKEKVNFLEHVQVFITVKATRRGDITMFLVSSMGTTSMILGKRPMDNDAHRGFTKWPFMTTHAWGENPRGKWRLLVGLQTKDPMAYGLISDVVVVLHGTQSKPYDELPSSLDDKFKKLGVVKRQQNSERFSI